MSTTKPSASKLANQTSQTNQANQTSQTNQPHQSSLVTLTNELRELDPALALLRSRISGLGAALFDLEQTPALPLASGSNYTGLTARTAKAMQDALAELWLGYPKLVAVMETLDTARGSDDSLRTDEREALRGLLVDGHVELGGMTLEQEQNRLSGLLASAQKNLETIDHGFAACATTLSDLDALARTAMISAEQTGERVNEVSRLAKQLSEQRVQAAADPLGWQSGAASSLGAQLRTLAAELGVVLQTQDRLPELVAGGGSRLDALRLVIANGIAAAAKTRSRMAAIEGLALPMRVSVLDGVDGLRNRLGAVRSELQVDPRKARQLWVLWDRDMTSTELSAHSVLQANVKPIAERDSLRGRLDGFEAKAAAGSIVEVPALVQLHRHATALLTTPPVVLEECEAAVAAYAQAVAAALAKRSETTKVNL